MLCSALLVPFPRFLRPLVLPQPSGFGLQGCCATVDVRRTSVKCPSNVVGASRLMHGQDIRNLCANLPFGLEGRLLRMRLKGLMIKLCAEFTNPRLLGVMSRNFHVPPSLRSFPLVVFEIRVLGCRGRVTFLAREKITSHFRHRTPIAVFFGFSNGAKTRVFVGHLPRSNQYRISQLTIAS
jgi:hypothetical protein